MTQRTRLATATLVLALGLPLAAAAQETVVTTTTTTTAAPAVPNLTQVLDASGITVNGHVDASYDAANTDTIALVPFYQNANSVVLHQAEVIVAKLPAEGFGAKVDLLAGSDARILNAPASGQSDNSSYFNLTQAFVQYAHGPVTVIAGKYTSLAGYEVIDSSVNPNATGSILFNFVPFIHTGVRGAYKLGNNTFTLGVANSQVLYADDNNRQKTVEAAYGLAVTPDWSLALTGYYGKEPTDSVVNPGTTTDRNRGTLDFVTNYKLTPDITVGANVDYVQQRRDQGKTEVTGAALYFIDRFRPDMRVALRGEYVKLKDTNFDGNVAEITATYGYAPVPSTELIAEVRYDRADDDLRGIFVSDVGATGNDDNSDQFLGTLKVIYKF